jgi:hypothetical protein
LVVSSGAPRFQKNIMRRTSVLMEQVIKYGP